MHDLDTLKQLNRTAVFGVCPSTSEEIFYEEQEANDMAKANINYDKRRVAEGRVVAEPDDSTWDSFPRSVWPSVTPESYPTDLNAFKPVLHSGRNDPRRSQRNDAEAYNMGYKAGYAASDEYWKAKTDILERTLKHIMALDDNTG